jgi:hypothetical protein
MTPVYDEFCLQRMVDAVEKVRQRHLRITAALVSAKIPCAVVGGQAVAWWMTKADRGGVRNTLNTDVLVDREYLPAATSVLGSAGFFAMDTDRSRFIDGRDGRPRDAARLLFAGEPFKQSSVCPSPQLSESVDGDICRVIALEPLVKMKLAAWRDVDRTHIDDLIESDLIDRTWPVRFPPTLQTRLISLLDSLDR